MKIENSSFDRVGSGLCRNTDTQEYQKYIARRNQNKKQEEKINSLESELYEMKKLLQKVINDTNN